MWSRADTNAKTNFKFEVPKIHLNLNIQYYIEGVEHIMAAKLELLLAILTIKHLILVHYFSEKSTSQLLLEPDWDSTLQICDCIRQGDVQ